eukprot:TRINITY_DN22613_c0_g2_i1.p1 TRINITY_DN22613_c0_g2~~TRINITY_DN22613_c0_g2_i1.p1  ORF type:complete len:258 (+),score=61.22 TRINITY_DN22613_c0_g2_i1:69-842(+)
MTSDAGLAHLASSKYRENVKSPGHQSIWGSWYDTSSGQWGYACCKGLGKKAQPCVLLESEAEGAESSKANESKEAKELPPVEWKPREEFETAEGFVSNTARCLASRWLRWLRDGTLSSLALDPESKKVLLSETAAKEAVREVEVFCKRLGQMGASGEIMNRLEDFCSSTGAREYVQANKAYMEIVMGARKWQGDVPYLVEGNRNGPAVVQSVAERINKTNSNPLDEAGIRDNAVLLRRLMKVSQAALPNDEPSKNCG